MKFKNIGVILNCFIYLNTSIMTSYGRFSFIFIIKSGIHESEFYDFKTESTFVPFLIWWNDCTENEHTFTMGADSSQFAKVGSKYCLKDDRSYW